MKRSFLYPISVILVFILLSCSYAVFIDDFEAENGFVIDNDIAGTNGWVQSPTLWKPWGGTSAGSLKVGTGGIGGSQGAICVPANETRTAALAIGPISSGTYTSNTLVYLGNSNRGGIGFGDSLFTSGSVGIAMWVDELHPVGGVITPVLLSTNASGVLQSGNSSNVVPANTWMDFKVEIVFGGKSTLSWATVDSITGEPTSNYTVISQIDTPFTAGNPLVYYGLQQSSNGSTIHTMFDGILPVLVASNPEPTDNDICVDPNADLFWEPSGVATAQEVYFGTDYNDVNDATDPNVLPGYGRQGPNTFDLGTMQEETTYYWRIDEVDTSGVHRGKVWNFNVNSTLDRGHYILLENGLQIQALPFLAPGTINMNRWQESNFNAFHFGSANWDDLFPGQEPNYPWGRWSASAPTTAGGNSHNMMVTASNYDEQGLGETVVNNISAWIPLMHYYLPHVIAHSVQNGHSNTIDALRNYVQQAKPDMLYFFHYSFPQYSNWPEYEYPGGSPTFFYSVMEKYRLIALEGLDGTGTKPIPVGQWIQTYYKDRDFNSVTGVFDNPGYKLSESELNLHYFASWTFGYKIIGAFTYATTDPCDEVASIFFDGPADTNPTNLFYRASELNEQSLNIGPAIIRLQNTDIRVVSGQYKDDQGVTQDIGLWSYTTPDTVWDNQADPYITDITATNIGIKNDGLRGDVLIGYFRPLSDSFVIPSYTMQELIDDSSYFMIFNGLTDRYGTGPETRQRIRLSFDFGASGISSIQRFSRISGEVETIPLIHISGSQYYYDLELDGGIGDMFTFYAFPLELKTEVIGGHGTIDPPTGIEASLDAVPLTAYPDPGYKVKQWIGSDDDLSTSSSNYVTLTRDTTVQVEFEKCFTADFDNDCIIDLIDLCVIADEWLDVPVHAGLNPDDIVDFKDYAVFAAEFEFQN